MHPGAGAVSRLGATILDAGGLRLTQDEKALFRDVRPFGFILFARNIESPDQVRALCAEMREAAGHAAVITIDQEGGRVQRLRAPHWRNWPAPLDQARQAGADAAQVMYLRYRLIAAELHALGIDSNCAPLVDVAGPRTHPFLRDRCYGDEAETVPRLGVRWRMDCWMAVSCRWSSTSPVTGAPRRTATMICRWSKHEVELQETDFKPFRR